MITEPMRITHTSATLLDVILTNQPEMFKKCGTVDPAISDHQLIFVIMKVLIWRYRPKVITFRSSKNTNTNYLNEDIANAPWHLGKTFDTVDNHYSYWKKFEKILWEHTPLKKMRVREKDVPYMNPGWKRAIRKKRKYAQTYSKDWTPEN